MVTVTLNLAGAGLVLLVALVGFLLFLFGNWAHTGYERRMWTEEIIASYRPEQLSPEQVAKWQSVRQGLRRNAILPVARPFAAVGWWIAGWVAAR